MDSEFSTDGREFLIAIVRQQRQREVERRTVRELLSAALDLIAKQERTIRRQSATINRLREELLATARWRHQVSEPIAS